MLNAIIIEDERPAQEHLLHLFSEINDSIRVHAMFSTVKEATSYLSTGPSADIIFSDVQLSDGYSFEIFQNINTRIPVIFITGYDEFIMNAFSCNGIDYLLKPLDKKELLHALNKYYRLEQHFAGQSTRFDQFFRQIDPKRRNRLIVRKGLEYVALKLEEVVLMYTDNKIVYVIDRFGKKYISENNLSQLEIELDHRIFFRANRQYIVNINFIKGYKSFEKVKLMIELNLPEVGRDIVVSQENASEFRKWMYEA